MENLQVFKNSEFGEIGVLMIEGKEYFPATACAKILGYSNPRKAIIDHCKIEGVTKRDAWVQTGIKADGTPAMRNTQTKYITESNLYRLISRSNLPAAEKFEHWVFDEVLPSIRKQGYYSTRDQLPLDEVTKIIQQTATAVMTEVIQQLVPAIIAAVQAQPPISSQPMQGQNIITFAMNNQPPVETPKPPRRQRERIHSKIMNLSPDVREDIRNMLNDTSITFDFISDWLKEQGFEISRSAVGRYYKSSFLPKNSKK